MQRVVMDMPPMILAARWHNASSTASVRRDARKLPVATDSRRPILAKPRKASVAQPHQEKYGFIAYLIRFTCY